MYSTYTNTFCSAIHTHVTLVDDIIQFVLLHTKQVGSGCHDDINQHWRNDGDEGVLPCERIEQRRNRMQHLGQGTVGGGSRYKLYTHSTCRQQACPCPRQPRLSDVLFGVRIRVGVRVVPEFLSHEDDSSFKHGGCKHLQHLLICETAEQCPEIHMLQPRVQRPCQTDDLETHRPGTETKRSSGKERWSEIWELFQCWTLGWRSWSSSWCQGLCVCLQTPCVLKGCGFLLLLCT